MFKSLLLASALTMAFSGAAMAQSVMGPTKIVSVTTNIWPGPAMYPLAQIADGNISDVYPFNGFAGADNATGTITFGLNTDYDLTSFHLWNDMNVLAEGVGNYSLKFYNVANVLVGSAGPYSTTAGLVAPHVNNFPMIGNVRKVELVVNSIQSLPNTAVKRVEIREVAFNGDPTPPVEPPFIVPGNHWQCYRVLQGPTLKPETLTVQDQFGKAQIVLARPLMLCNPSLKIHGDRKYDIEFKERHLVCYQPVKQSDQQPKRKVKINNQMAPATLVLAERQMFCVPSIKKRLDAPDQPVGF